MSSESGLINSLFEGLVAIVFGALLVVVAFMVATSAIKWAFPSNNRFAIAASSDGKFMRIDTKTGQTWSWSGYTWQPNYGTDEVKEPHPWQSLKDWYNKPSEPYVKPN